MSIGQGPNLRDVSAGDLATLDRVAELHVRLLSPGPLAAMGADFVRDVALRLLLAEGLLRLAVLETPSELCGFVAFTGQSDGYQLKGFKRHPFTTVGAGLSALLQRPARMRALVHMFQDMLREPPAIAGAPGTVGEVVAIVVTPEFLQRAAAGKGGPHAGDRLLDHAIDQLRAGGVRKLRARINADRRGALLLYARRSATYQDYRNRGEDMVQVTLDL